MRSNNSGFHLIEVVISVALIAILVQLASPRFTQAQEKSNQLNMLARLSQMQLSLEYCYAKENSYLACKDMDGIEASSQLYTITLLSPLNQTPCYRWVVNHKNELHVYGRDGREHVGCV